VNEDLANKLVRCGPYGQEVVAKGGSGDVHARGKVIAYSIKPQVLILTETGERIWWRVDMTEVAE
jgi:hypothetical protein